MKLRTLNKIIGILCWLALLLCLPLIYIDFLEHRNPNFHLYKFIHNLIILIITSIVIWSHGARTAIITTQQDYLEKIK